MGLRGQSNKPQSSVKRIGNKKIAIGEPTNATRNGESMEDLNEPGIGFAVTTSESSPDSINTKRFGMASPPASPVLAGEPPSPQSTLAAFRFGGSAQSSRPASPKSITPPAAAVSDDSEDIVPGVIQFRSPLSRQQSRVLYDGSAQASPALRTYMPGSAYFDSRRKSSASSGMSWAHTPASEDRRPSLVKPEDYLPGLPAAANAGKAMAAGFEPARTAAPQHSAIPLPRRSSYTPKPPRALKGMQSKLDVTIDESQLNLDLGEIGQDGFENDYDVSKIYGADRSDEDLNAVSVPTLYSNSYVGEAKLSFREAEDAAKKQHEKYTSFSANTKLPRDSETGRIDWRARLQVKSAKSPITQTDIQFMENNPGWEITAPGKGFSKFTESFEDEKSYTSEKPSPNILTVNEGQPSRFQKFLLALSPFTYVIAQGALVYYLFKRCSYIVGAERETGKPFIGAWLFFAFEAFFGLMTISRATFQLSKLKLKATPRYTIKGDIALPTVDVLILATGQETAMVMDATIAAARLDWPVDKLRVLVIDETASPNLERCVDSYAHSRAIHVTYHKRSRQSMYARDPSALSHKSTTINFGLTETRAEGRISGEYTVIVEAESIVENHMLRALLPHMLKSPLTALVRTPGGFYNLPKSLGGSFGTFVGCVEPVEDARSAFALRRSAIDDVGGFPTRSSIEDGRLEAILLGRGYKTTWAADTVQYSMIPDSFSSHLRQRVDRRLAHLTTAFRMGLFFMSSKVQYMPFTARVAGLGRALTPFASIFVFLNMVLFPVAVFYDRSFLVPALSLSELNITVWAALAAVLSERVHDFCSVLPAGHVSARRFVQSQVFIAPYTILGLLRKLVPSFLRRMPEPYWTPSDFGEPKERDPKCRQSLGRRLLSVILFTHGWVHALVIGGLLAAIGHSLFSSIRPYALGQRSLHQTGLLILMTVVWPTLPWMNVLLGSLVPFIYALFPPSVQSRERLLYREPISTVARPLQDHKRALPLKERFFGQFLLSAILIGYVCAVFALTFVDLHVK